MLNYLKYYFFLIAKVFLMAVLSFPVYAENKVTCSGDNLVFGSVDFGGPIQVNDSDPINTVLKEVVVNQGMSATCYITDSWQGYLLEKVEIGEGRVAISSFPGKESEICASNVPGIGYQLVFDGPGSGWLWIFGPKNRCSYQAPGDWRSGGPLGITSVIAPGAIKVRLIKTGKVPANPTTLQGRVFGLSRSHGPLSFAIYLNAKNVVISSQIPSCTFAGTNSQTVSFDRVETKALQDNTAPYKTFTLPFNCEAGAKLELAQLHIDGAGVSANRPGLVSIDNSQANSAQNTLIEVTDTNQQRLPFKQNIPMSSVSVIGNGNAYNIPFQARLYSEPGKLVTPGKVSASLTFTLIQQ